MSRLWVRISKCSRESLSTWGLRITQNRLMCVGRGTGPPMRAPVLSAVSTICPADRSSILWSKALRMIRTFCLVTILVFLHRLSRFDLVLDRPLPLPSANDRAQQVFWDRLIIFEFHGCRVCDAAMRPFFTAKYVFTPETVFFSVNLHLDITLVILLYNLELLLIYFVKYKIYLLRI